MTLPRNLVITVALIYGTPTAAQATTLKSVHPQLHEGWHEDCSYGEYVEHVENFIVAAPRGAESVAAIAGAFASIHLADPKKFLWPGMASYAQASFVEQILNSPVTTQRVKSRAIEATHEVLRTGYTPLFIYQTAGIDEIERLFHECRGSGIDPMAIQGLRLIETGSALADAGRDEEATVRFEAGNKLLLEREHAVLQNSFYSHDLGILGHALSTFACVNFSGHPQDLQCFATAFPFSRFENLRKRTQWNTDFLLPSFVENFHQLQRKFDEIVSLGQNAGGRYPRY